MLKKLLKLVFVSHGYYVSVRLGGFGYEAVKIKNAIRGNFDITLYGS
ncbi:hypothetical protein AGMMS49957_13990 [Synergistales bacterium]|nr:hypothetical protein AGMMS49957_13990 [Synergistales bacterium]